MYVRYYRSIELQSLQTGLQSLEDNIQHLSMEKSKLMTQHKNVSASVSDYTILCT